MQKENRTPQPVRWGEKRFYSLDYYLKQTYGHKLYKIALDAGMTCPTRDGTLGTRGCIFCSAKGSGDFAADRSLSVTEQLSQGKEIIRNKFHADGYIAYFQAFTNTYAPALNDCARFLYRSNQCAGCRNLIHRYRDRTASTGSIRNFCRTVQIKPVRVELGL